MLVQFSVTNYKSICDTAELSLLEANITEFTGSLIRNRLDGVGILPVTLIYGTNGSGKSAVLEAAAQIKKLVQHPEEAMAEDDRFAFHSEKREQPTEYDLVFRGDYREYEYQVKVKDGLVDEETLYARKLTDTTYDVVFDRDIEGVYLGEWLEDLDISSVTDEQPMLSFVLNNRKTEEFLEISRLLDDICFVDCSSLDNELLYQVCRDTELEALLLKMLSCVDGQICGLRLEDGRLFVEHAAASLPFEAEGKGVQQLIRLYAAAAWALDGGRTLLADDANQKLHPKAFRFLLELFTNPGVNKKGTQFIATSYDMPTMANSVLRRDEIWICDKNEKGETSLYTLALFLKENGEKVRKDETYFKQFLEGRYGTDLLTKPMPQED